MGSRTEMRGKEIAGGGGSRVQRYRMNWDCRAPIQALVVTFLSYNLLHHPCPASAIIPASFSIQTHRNNEVMTLGAGEAIAQFCWTI